MGGIKSNIFIFILIFAASRMAWWGNPIFLPMALLLPLLWVLSKNIYYSMGLVFLYYLAASWEAKEIIGIFFNSSFKGSLYWLIASIFLTLPFGIFFTKNKQLKPLLTTLAVIISIVPPFGIIGWANPITCAGMLFPKTGSMGIILLLLIIFILGHFALIKPKSTILLVMILPLFSVRAEVKAPTEWSCLHTSSEYYYNEGNFYEDHLRILELQEKISRCKANILIVPEGALGLWTEATEKLWTSTENLKDRIILGGAKMPPDEANVLVKLNRGKAEVVYKQQIAPPIKTNKFLPDFNVPEILEFKDKKVSPLICYEGFLIWPVISRMFLYKQEADVLLCVSNFEWMEDGIFMKIIKKQKEILTVWSVLYNAELATSFNNPGRHKNET